MPLRNRSRLEDFKCFFITTTCYKWQNVLINDSYFSILYNSLSFVNEKYKGKIVSYVFMSNHVHFIIFFEEKNYISEYMRDFKKFTSGEIRRKLQSENYLIILESLGYRKRDQIYKVWMDRFDDVIIRSSKVMFIKLNYIHYNPVRKGIVALPEDYKHSSAAFYFLGEEPVLPILHYKEII